MHCYVSEVTELEPQIKTGLLTQTVQNISINYFMSKRPTSGLLPNCSAMLLCEEWRMRDKGLSLPAPSSLSVDYFVLGNQLEEACVVLL